MTPATVVYGQPLDQDRQRCIAKVLACATIASGPRPSLSLIAVDRDVYVTVPLSVFPPRPHPPMYIVHYLAVCPATNLYCALNSALCPSAAVAAVPVAFLPVQDQLRTSLTLRARLAVPLCTEDHVIVLVRTMSISQYGDPCHALVLAKSAPFRTVVLPSTPVAQIPGVSGAHALRLRDAGIHTAEQFARLARKDLARLSAIMYPSCRSNVPGIHGMLEALRHIP